MSEILAPVDVAYVDVGDASANVALPIGGAFSLTFRADTDVGHAGGGCWVEIGNSSVAAAVAAGQSFWVPKNAIMIIKIPSRGKSTNNTNPTHIAAITNVAGATGAGTLTVVGLG